MKWTFLPCCYMPSAGEPQRGYATEEIQDSKPSWSAARSCRSSSVSPAEGIASAEHVVARRGGVWTAQRASSLTARRPSGHQRRVDQEVPRRSSSRPPASSRRCPSSATASAWAAEEPLWKWLKRTLRLSCASTRTLSGGGGHGPGWPWVSFGGGCPARARSRCLQQEPCEPEVCRRGAREELGLCRGRAAWGGSWPARTRVWRSSDAAAAEARGMGLGRVRCGRGRGGARMRPWVRAAVSPRPPSTRRPRPDCAVRVRREEGGEVGGEQAGLRRRHGGRMLWWRWLMPKPNTGHVGGSGTTVRMKFAIFPFSETGFAKIPLNFWIWPQCHYNTMSKR